MFSFFTAYVICPGTTMRTTAGTVVSGSKMPPKFLVKKHLCHRIRSVPTRLSSGCLRICDHRPGMWRSKKAKSLMIGFPMMILQVLMQEGPLTAAQIATMLQERASKRVLDSSINSTLKNMESCKMIGRSTVRQTDRPTASRRVTVYTLLPAGRERAEHAVRNLPSLN